MTKNLVKMDSLNCELLSKMHNIPGTRREIRYNKK